MRSKDANERRTVELPVRAGFSGLLAKCPSSSRLTRLPSDFPGQVPGSGCSSTTTISSTATFLGTFIIWAPQVSFEREYRGEGQDQIQAHALGHLNFLSAEFR